MLKKMISGFDADNNLSTKPKMFKQKIIDASYVQVGTKITVRQPDGNIVKGVVGEAYGDLVIQDLEGKILYKFEPAYIDDVLTGYKLYGANGEDLNDKIILYNKLLSRLIVLNNAHPQNTKFPYISDAEYARLLETGQESENTLQRIFKRLFGRR
jgi:hypothetical protein